MQLTVNLEHVDPAVRQSIIKGIRHEDKARHDLGVVEQIKLKKFADQVTAAGMNTELGRNAMVISEGQYQAAQQLYGELCWADPDFGKWLLKRDSDFAVKDVGTRIQSGYTGRGHSRARR